LSICIVVSLILYKDYSFTDSEQLLASLNEPTQIEVYKWEYMEALTQEELLLYLIDEQSEEEFFDLADNSNELFSALQSVKWEKK